MTWGGALMYIDPETGEPVFPQEVASEELAMWEEILRKAKEAENVKFTDNSLKGVEDE